MDLLRGYHSQQFVLSLELEALADTFPQYDAGGCAAIRATLLPRLRTIHFIEERWIFAALERRLPPVSIYRSLIQRLVDEHGEDRDAAIDLSLELVRLHERNSRQELEGIAFQTRALFRSLRRHAACEADILIPAIRRFLSRQEVGAVIDAYRRPSSSQSAGNVFEFLRS
ncbi:hemerythrin domain-containing protein [Aureimonas sp. AU4]|uniref:hemerythrin domain-containing protein n=1 Tax=Aureimonas sp. AU4 TaxID=1638163 RepID=UPI000785C85A|nr:hemerythrin domain-containing protein [Aureimonas sp. AU4]